MIAMALICQPALLIADEPTTALDVTTQAQILDLIKELQAETGMSVLLITHDLGVVANVADEVVVMYRGEVMEAGSREDIFRRPQHPYLQALHARRPALRHGRRRAADADPRGQEHGAGADRTAESQPMPTGPILQAEDLTKTFTLRSGWFSGKVRTIHAVNGVEPRPAGRQDCSGSWANPVAARPPCPKSSCGR